MAIIQSLPFELLVRIFQQIDTLTQAAECRLVCRAWRDPAEKVMFEHTITIRSDDTIAKLLTVFARDPTKATLIKHVNFDNLACDSKWLDVFLTFALTQKIESLTGSLAENHIGLILQHVKSSPAGMFCNMRTLNITAGGGPSILSLQELSLILCETLETMRLVFDEDGDWNFVDNLAKFTRLKHLYIEGYIKGISDVNKALDNCQQLEHVTMEHLVTEEDLTHSEAMIQRKHNLKTFTIGEAYEFMYDLIIGYFVSKCPGLSKVTVDFFADYDFVDVGSFPLVGPIIQKIPQKEFRVHIQCTKDDTASVRYVRQHFNRVLVDHITVDCRICLKIEDFD